MFIFSTLAVAASLVAAVAADHGHSLQARSHHHHVERSNLQKRFSGTAIYYQTGTGACGQFNNPGDFIVALNSAQYGGGYPGPNCFKAISICAKGKCVGATIVDECPTCGYGSLDLSQGLFEQFASTDAGVFQMTWSFADGGGEPQPSTTKKPDPPAPTTTWKPEPSPEPTTSWKPEPTTTWKPEPTTTWKPEPTTTWEEPKTTSTKKASTSTPLPRQPLTMSPAQPRRAPRPLAPAALRARVPSSPLLLLARRSQFPQVLLSLVPSLPRPLRLQLLLVQPPAQETTTVPALAPIWLMPRRSCLGWVGWL